jgi:hypothetical protein
VELREVALDTDVWQVRHHVRHHLEAGVLGEVEGLRDRAHGMAPVRVPRDVLVHGLHADLKPRAAVAEHLTALRERVENRRGMEGTSSAA